MYLTVLLASLMVILSSAFEGPIEVQGQATKQAETSALAAEGVPQLPKSPIVRNSYQKNTGPVVEAWEPKTGSTNTIIYLSGYRLNPSEWDKTKVLFIQNGVEVSAPNVGGWLRTNDLVNGPQTLAVVVPEGAVPGKAQIVVEFEGRRSAPATITITEWKLPIVKSINPTRGAPGTFVKFEGEAFHVNDQIELTDDAGATVTTNSGDSSSGLPIIRIPENAAEGVITMRIGNRKYGNGQYTEPVTFTVTNEPLPVELLTSDMHSVAPGQWLDLQISNLEPLKRSELTEISFRQAGRTIIVPTTKPYRTHVAVPGVLSPGEVQLQLRTWREGRPSQWSEPASFELANKPVAPIIASIRLENGRWASLAPGPDRKKSFTVGPGETVVLNGLWPVPDASTLKVSLVRPGSMMTITPTELDEKQNWFADVQVRLPESLEAGDWRMIVSSETDGSQSEVPIVIRVVQK